MPSSLIAQQCSKPHAAAYKQTCTVCEEINMPICINIFTDTGKLETLHFWWELAQDPPRLPIRGFHAGAVQTLMHACLDNTFHVGRVVDVLATWTHTESSRVTLPRLVLPHTNILAPSAVTTSVWCAPNAAIFLYKQCPPPSREADGWAGKGTS